MKNPLTILSDFFSKLVIEHGSATIQEKHITLLKEQFTLLEKDNLALKSENSILKSENQNLKNENVNLKQKIQIHNETPKPFFHANLLWLPNDANPYCPACYETDNKLIHMATVSYQEEINGNIIQKYVFRCSTSPKCNHRAEVTNNPKIK